MRGTILYFQGALLDIRLSLLFSLPTTLPYQVVESKNRKISFAKKQVGLNDGKEQSKSIRGENIDNSYREEESIDWY